MNAQLIPMAELNRKAFEILARELGVADAVRLFGQIGAGTGNYTEARRELFADLTLEEIDEGIRILHAAMPDESTSERIVS